MELKNFGRRLILGIPLLAPAYTVNLAVVWIMINVIGFTGLGLLSSIVIGDAVAYAFNIYLSPVVLKYLKYTKYYSKEELTA